MRERTVTMGRQVDLSDGQGTGLMKLGDLWCSFMHAAASSFRFKRAGSLVGDDVAELGQCWSTASSALGSRPFLVDIDDLSEVDEYGRELLRQWHEQGAHFLARSAAARLLAETITGSPVPAVTPAHAPLPGWL